MYEKKSISIDIDELVNSIITQTTYTKKEAEEKLIECDYDYIKVIKNFMGIKKEINEKTINSLNQEIYKQIRYKLDSSMKEYREKNPFNLDEISERLQESENLKNNRK
jgi:uncharacterized protein YllA (UPF0747 family)